MNGAAIPRTDPAFERSLFFFADYASGRMAALMGLAPIYG